MSSPRLRTALIVANFAMLAIPTYAVAGDGGELAAGLALGCCAGMAGAAMVASADDHHRPPREVHHVTEVHHVADQPSARLINHDQARAELAEAELWSQQHCVAELPQPPGVKVFITFRGGDGRATKAWFEPALEGEAFSACMQRAFSSTRVDPFDLLETTVSKSLGGA